MPTFRPLRRETGPEPFRILADDWNSMVRFFRDHHNLICGPGNEIPIVPHAWKMQARWDEELEEWVLKVAIPGFVRGWDVAITTKAYLAGPDTRKRLEIPEELPPRSKEGEKRVKAFLTEFPEFSVAVKQWENVVTEGSMQLEGGEFRAIPEWLQKAYNILIPENVRTNTQALSIETTNAEEMMEQDRDTARLLKCIEVVLKQPRPRIIPVVSSEAAAIATGTVEMIVRYDRPDDNPPWLELSNLPPVEITASTKATVSMALGGADLGYDVCPIATIWLCGPPGKLNEEKATADWTPVIQYHTMYSLDYTVSVEVDRIPPLRLVNPAIGLAGSTVAQMYVDMLNETFRQMEEMYGMNEVNGSFWTV